MKTSIIAICLFLSTSVVAQYHHFTGNWIKLNTTYLFEFDLLLKHEGKNVKGYFNWKVIDYDRNSEQSRAYYSSKIGARAKEYVQGTYHPETKQYELKGYKKDDPNNVIGLDTYRLKLVGEEIIEGPTKANASWKGRIKGTKVSMKLML